MITIALARWECAYSEMFFKVGEEPSVAWTVLSWGLGTYFEWRWLTWEKNKKRPPKGNLTKVCLKEVALCKWLQNCTWKNFKESQTPKKKTNPRKKTGRETQQRAFRRKVPSLYRVPPVQFFKSYSATTPVVIRQNGNWQRSNLLSLKLFSPDCVYIFILIFIYANFTRVTWLYPFRR